MHETTTSYCKSLAQSYLLLVDMERDKYPLKRIVFDTDRQVTRRPLKNKIFLDE